MFEYINLLLLYFVVVLFTKAVGPRRYSSGKRGPELNTFVERWSTQILQVVNTSATFLHTPLVMDVYIKFLCVIV